MMNHLQNIQAVAFDLDGTLVDSIPDLAASANAMRVELGLSELPRQTVQSFVGDGIGTLVHRALTEQRNGIAEQDLWEKGFSAFVRHYAAHIANATRPYPETQAALGLLKTLELPLAVVTNKSEMLAVKLLKDLNLDDHFSMIVGGDTLTHRKPHPEPLLWVAEILGVAPESLLMVGDSENDILAAKAAGCPSVGVSFGYGDMQKLSENPETKPDLIVNQLPEIYEQIKAAKKFTGNTQ